MAELLTLKGKVYFRTGVGRRKQVHAEPLQTPRGRMLRVTRLMALAVKFDGLVRCGQITSYAELARLGHVTRARITQIMNLLLLAPALQEELLFLPRTERSRDPIYLRDLQPIARETDWHKQRQLWKQLGILPSEK